jgi:hypothetical protein
MIDKVYIRRIGISGIYRENNKNAPFQGHFFTFFSVNLKLELFEFLSQVDRRILR